jgi:hypothetical protein
MLPTALLAETPLTVTVCVAALTVFEVVPSSNFALPEPLDVCRDSMTALAGWICTVNCALPFIGTPFGPEILTVGATVTGALEPICVIGQNGAMPLMHTQPTLMGTAIGS